MAPSLAVLTDDFARSPAGREQGLWTVKTYLEVVSWLGRYVMEWVGR